MCMWAWGEYLLLAIVDSLLNGEGNYLNQIELLQQDNID